MTSADLTQALAVLATTAGVEWSYDGDWSTLDPVADGDGNLVSRGLEWHGDTPPPTLEEIQAAVASIPATAADHAAVSASIITERLASVPIPRAHLDTILEQLLGEAASAIPFFETYALDPSMTSAQWTAFQSLGQEAKDRLLYDVVRSMAALMRYLSGDLPPLPE